ncbi:hypothetical protein [Haliea sp.]|uniref:hypothetical protein n=1 Tax=Haliea sp. TaxID=1932666 RepID=UPI00257CCFE5|nr:hypothetical protein [Haliea sp.]
MENHVPRRYSRNYRKAVKYMLVSMVLGALLIVTGVGWIVTAYKLSSMNDLFLGREVAVRGEDASADNLRNKVAALEQQVSKLREEKASLVQNRIPDLNPLAFDAIVPIGERYLKNIRFTRTGTEQQKRFGYLAVLQNDGQRSINPDVTIILFDSLGIQVGMAQLAKDETSSDMGNDELNAGESRSYFSQVKLTRDRDPEYFHVEVK